MLSITTETLDTSRVRTDNNDTEETSERCALTTFIEPVTTQKTGPKSTTPKFREIKRVYKKTENHSYAGKRLEQRTKQNHNYA